MLSKVIQDKTKFCSGWILITIASIGIISISLPQSIDWLETLHFKQSFLVIMAVTFLMTLFYVQGYRLSKQSVVIKYGSES